MKNFISHHGHFSIKIIRTCHIKLDKTITREIKLKTQNLLGQLYWNGRSETLVSHDNNINYGRYKYFFFFFLMLRSGKPRTKIKAIN